MGVYFADTGFLIVTRFGVCVFLLFGGGARTWSPNGLILGLRGWFSRCATPFFKPGPLGLVSGQVWPETGIKSAKTKILYLPAIIPSFLICVFLLGTGSGLEMAL